MSRRGRARPGRPAVELRGLTKRFGRVWALRGVDLEVEPGEVFGYLGPNGAGKTTTIRLLLDLIRPTQGSVRVLGSPPGEGKTRRRIGYLPAELHFPPRWTARDVVELFSALRGGGGGQWADELCARFDLDPSRPVGELSTGNRRKVGIVQAFAHRPELLVLDEPTSGLDPLLQHSFQELVQEAVGWGATVFLSSHQLGEVEALADRVGILRRGELVEVASVSDLERRAGQRIDLYVSGRASARPFASLPGVVSATTSPGVVHVAVAGSVDPVIKAAAKLRVRRIVTHTTDLEDVFLDLYRDDDSTKGGAES